MKNLLFVILMFFIYISSKAQNIERIQKKFWRAVKADISSKIISNGNILIYLSNEKKYQFDSSLIEIKMITASNLSKVANGYYIIGNYQKSLDYNLKSLDLRESVMSKDNPDYAWNLNEIALNYVELGENNQALFYYNAAIKIHIEKLKKEHLDYAVILSNLALTYDDMGFYSKSLELNLEALEFSEKTYGKSNDQYALVLNNIAINYNNLGEFTKSLEYNLLALDIRKKTLGLSDLYYATSLNNIAVNYYNLGDYKKSLEYNFLSLEIRKNILGKVNADYATSLNNIAATYSSLHNYIKSKEYYLKAVKIRAKTLGTDHPEYAVSLNNFALLLDDLGEYENSTEYFFKALEILENTQNIFIGIVMQNIALNSCRIGEVSTCCSYLYKSFLYDFESFKINLNGTNKLLQEANKIRLDQSFKFNASLLLREPMFYDDLFRNWINLNGIISNKSQILAKEIFESQNSLLKATFEEYKYKKKQFLNLQESSIKNKKAQDTILSNLEVDICMLEQKLSNNSQAFNNFNRQLSSCDLSSSLDECQFLLDIIRIPYYSFYSNKWTDSVKYLVFVTNSADTLVDYLFINEGKELENEIQFDYKTEASDKSKATDLKNEIFYNSLWKPIADKIGDAKTVYVSLGGVYNNINLNTLYNPETDKYLIEEKDIRIVNSARDFVLMKERLSAEAGEKKQYASSTSALYGFPDFNGNATTSVDSADYLASTRDLNAIWIDSLTRGGLKASPLPATKVEVEQIAGTFQKNGWKVTTYTGENASETNIKKEISPRVLHVATHGYFFEDIPLDTIDNRFLGMDRSRVVQDPMLRSGLLFTGANKTLQGEESKGENGLLSAAEASLLDLRETELVVLSACETGKGEVKNSEGVYGLRKAFADAGAQNIIMSLWKVDDKVTQEFMTRFYEIWLNEKTTIREAFNRTQLEIKAKYPQPYYWGAFILIGE